MQLTEQQRSSLSTYSFSTRPEFPTLISNCPDNDIVTVEEFSKIMHTVHHKGNGWVEAMRTHSSDGATTALEDAITPVFEEAGKVSAASNGRQPFVMVGNTDAGKSFVTNAVSRVSESDRTQYGSVEKKPEENPEAVDYLSGLPFMQKDEEKDEVSGNAKKKLD